MASRTLIFCLMLMAQAALASAGPRLSPLNGNAPGCPAGFQNLTASNVKKLANQMAEVRTKHPDLVIKQGTPVYRGFAIENYDETNLIRFFKGDRSQEIRSWNYSKLLNAKLKAGVPLERALTETDEEIAAQISKGLEWPGPQMWAARQRMGTFAGDTNSNALNFATRIEGSVHYAHSNIEKLRKEKPNDTLLQRAFVLDVVEKKPNGILNVDSNANPIGGVEYHMMSHVQAADVRGAYVGYPTAGENQLRWYYVQIEKRNANGAAIEYSIYEARESELGLAKMGGAVYQSGRTPHRAVPPTLRRLVDQIQLP